MSSITVSSPSGAAAREAAGSSAGGDRMYWPELDGLRFVAFLLVYLFHGGVPQFAGWVNEGLRNLAARLPFDPSWARPNWGATIQGNGWTGVQLFFLLSGYLIARLLLRERVRFGRIDLRAFWVRRILRIWPLYYAIVLVGFVLIPWSRGGLTDASGRQQLATHLGPFCLFLGNWSMGLLGPVSSDALSVLWSVCVEEQFYLFVPLLIAWCGPRVRLILVLVLMALAIAWRGWLASRDVSPLLFQYSTPTQADSLLSGVLLAIGLHHWTPGLRWRRVFGWLQWPVLLAFIGLLAWPGLARGSVAMRAWGFVPLWALGAALVGVLTAGDGPVGRFLAHRWLVWLGRISYGLYMVHELALDGTRRVVEAVGWFPNQEILTSLAALGATIGLAAVSYYGLELPFLRLKGRWTRVASRPID